MEKYWIIMGVVATILSLLVVDSMPNVAVGYAPPFIKVCPSDQKAQFSEAPGPVPPAFRCVRYCKPNEVVKGKIGGAFVYPCYCPGEWRHMEKLRAKCLVKGK